MAMKYGEKHWVRNILKTPRQEGESCRGVGQGITGTLRYG